MRCRSDFVLVKSHEKSHFQCVLCLERLLQLVSSGSQPISHTLRVVSFDEAISSPQTERLHGKQTKKQLSLSAKLGLTQEKTTNNQYRHPLQVEPRRLSHREIHVIPYKF